MTRRTPRLPLVLFALLTAMTLGGPLTLWAVIRGGASPEWPPDRPVEWWMLLGTIGLFAALLLACLGTAAAALRAMKQPSRSPADLDLGAPAPPDTADAPADLDLHLDRPGAPRDENDLRL